MADTGEINLKSAYLYLFISLLLLDTVTAFYRKDRDFRNRMQDENCPHCMSLTKHKHLLRIKHRILQKLGMNNRVNSLPQLPELPQGRALDQVDTTEQADLLSYSESSAFFKDDNILQFDLKKNTLGRKIQVEGANLLVRIKYPKRLRLQSVKKRDRKGKLVNLTISTVNSRGQPNKIVASVSTKVKKTKEVNFRIPESTIQNALDSENQILELYVSCNGCIEGIQLVMVHKRRRKRRRIEHNETDESRLKLNKRRPMLILHTRVTLSKRKRRSTRQCRKASCRKVPLIVDFEEFGWDWIISPKRFRTAFCEGNCTQSSEGAHSNISSASQNLVLDCVSGCVPKRTKHLKITYYDENRVIMHTDMANMIITKCGCKK